MSLERKALLKQILEALYQLEICEDSSRAKHLANLNSLLDEAVKGTNVSRYELLEALKERMQEYRKSRRKQDMPWPHI